MKITKYPQSCFMVEFGGLFDDPSRPPLVGRGGEKRVLVDPGNLSYEAGFAAEWAKADAVLITHKHGDHCHAEVLKGFVDVPIYASAEVAAEYPMLPVKAVKEGDVVSLFGGASAEAVRAVHGYIPWLKGKGEIHENIGWILSAEGKRVWFTSDTICFKNDYKCDVLCAPVSGHGLVMSPFEAALFAKECGASLILPCHRDNPKFPVDAAQMEAEFAAQAVDYYRVLKSGETEVL